jgi:hypothetical protein
VTTVDDKTQKKNIRKMPNYTVEVATSFFAFTNEIYGKVEQVQVPSFPKQIAIEDVQGQRRFFDLKGYEEFSKQFPVKKQVSAVQWYQQVAESQSPPTRTTLEPRRRIVKAKKREDGMSHEVAVRRLTRKIAVARRR